MLLDLTTPVDVISAIGQRHRGDGFVDEQEVRPCWWRASRLVHDYLGRFWLLGRTTGDDGVVVDILATRRHVSKGANLLSQNKKIKMVRKPRATNSMIRDYTW